MSTTGALSDADKKWWQPADQVVNWIAAQIPEGSKVLEIGPGFVPFPKATHYVDYRELPGLPKEKVTSVDLNKQPLPFADKEFDFVYCRHVIEDMFNPFLLIGEMERVGKRGYIETPSPVAEVCRGVDGASPPFRGYHHHHSICWVFEGQLRLINKYPIIEYMRFDEEALAKVLRQGPENWNSHYLWEDKINLNHRQNGPDYVITRDYAAMVQNAIDVSQISNSVFWTKIKTQDAKVA